MIEVDGVRLCTEAFGAADDPAVLLVMGIGASMLWWEDDFCRRLASAGRYVIRYDHRDTGRSATYEPGRPPYSGGDLATDALRVLDGYDLESAHLVGVSAGGAFAQVLALDHPERVRSLVLLSTSPTTPGDRNLPPPSTAFRDFVAHARVDWTDDSSVLAYLLGYSRLLAGGQRPFDEGACRRFLQRDLERTEDVAAVQNHDLLAEDDRSFPPLASITAPTLVLHGTADPLFPPSHAAALAAEIPSARLVLLDGAGHGVDRADWDTILAAIVDHTGPAARTGDS
jgi:pimeloyl-ACP methyl ester carboxylesterase